MQISLILATINRQNELKELLYSLLKQTYKNFEVIIIDQNKDNKLEPIVEQFKELKIQHIKISQLGLSNARNIALKYVNGDIIGFPDDDCLYESNTLDLVSKYFKNFPDVDIISGICLDTKTSKKYLSTFSDVERYLNKYNLLGNLISTSFFVRKKIVQENNIKFDVGLGVGSGSILGAGEETDFVLQLYNLGIKIYYTPKIIVKHPLPEKQSKNNNEKYFKYNVGLGYLFAKYNYNILFIIYKIFVKPILSIIFYLIKADLATSKFYLNVLKGRYLGYQLYKRGTKQ